MSEGQTLFLILSLLYLSDCLVWVGRRTVLFASSWCRSWRTTYANEISGNANGSLAILNPLPPLGTAVAGHWCPVSISPIGVCDFSLAVLGGKARPIQSGRCLRHDDIVNQGADGKHLVLNGERFAKCESAEQADHLAEIIGMLRDESAENRETAIRDFLEDRFSKASALARWNDALNLLPDIRWTAILLFLFLYILVPIMAAVYGLTRLVIPAAIVMVLMASVIAFQYFRAHKQLYPKRKGERVSNVFKMILCPPAAIRAGDLLTIESLTRFHPALIWDVLPRAGGRDFYEPILRDLRNPLSHEHTEPDTLAIAPWYAEAEIAAIDSLLNTRDGSLVDDCLASPQWDGSSKAYCPRCACQLSVSSGECPDCPGVLLVPFSSSNRAEVPNGKL